MPTTLLLAHPGLKTQRHLFKRVAEVLLTNLYIVLLRYKVFKTVMVRRGILAIKFYCEHAKSNNT